MQNPKLVEAWKARAAKIAEGDKLWAEGSKLFANGSKLRAEARKLRAEGDKLWAEGNIAWFTAVIEVHGDIEIEWLPGDCSFRLGNGEVYGPAAEQSAA